MIQKRSGHCSLTALHAYERLTAEQILETSKILAPPTEREPNQKASPLEQNPTKVVVQITAAQPFFPTNLFSSCSFNNSVIQIQVGESSCSAICSRDSSSTKAILEELEDINIDEFFKDS